jgi:hypothetical protein
MKLVSVTLQAIRRFTKPVRIQGIGPGLNVLCAPNENGKSTLFDALQALFFQPHGTQGKDIRDLKPLAGGTPIKRMFDALHGEAADLQIIAFSRRQRAFRDLGGTKLVMKDAPV